MKVSNSERDNSFSRAKMSYYCLRSIVTVMGTRQCSNSFYYFYSGNFFFYKLFLIKNVVLITFFRSKVSYIKSNLNKRFLEQKFVRTKVVITKVVTIKVVTTKVVLTKVC